MHFCIILLKTSVLKEGLWCRILYFDDRFLIELFLPPIGIASLCTLTQADEMKFTFSRAWTLGLIIFGVVFDVASLFFPWGILTSSSMYVYLPGSIVNGEGVPLQISDLLIMMEARGQLITISKLIKAAIVVGWAGVVLHWYVERRALLLVRKRIISYGVILASSVLSFMAVAMFTLTGISLSRGAYLALVGGVLIVLGIVLKELKVEVVVEREVSEQEE